MWFFGLGAATINGTEAEDQEMRQGHQNTDKLEAFRFLMPVLEGVAGLPFTARIERAPSEYLLFSPVTLSGLAARAIPTAAVERALFHRARSGSKGMPWL